MAAQQGGEACLLEVAVMGERGGDAGGAGVTRADSPAPQLQ